MELLLLRLIFRELIQHLLFLSQERAGKRKVLFQLILIQILRGEPVQLLDHNAFQLFHGNKCAGTGLFRNSAVGALEIVPPAVFRGAHSVSAVGAANLFGKEPNRPTGKGLCLFIY